MMSAKQDAEQLFASVVGAMLSEPKVTQSKMFGSTVLKVAGKVFAMLVKGKLVVKLPRERVEALISSKDGEHFDPGHGKLSKEWLAVKSGSKTDWLELAREAKGFVAPNIRKRSK